MKEKNSLDSSTQEFQKICVLIQQAKQRALKQVNTTLIELYWNIGKILAEKTQKDHWGKNVVDNLSQYILTKEPQAKGFSTRNLWRMKQFYEAYKSHEKLPAMLTEITWTNHLHILSKTKSEEEQQFYLELAAKQRYSERDFARIIDSGVFERTMLANQKLPALLTEFPVNPKDVFKDIYLFEFTGITEPHKELDLQGRLLKYLQKFLLEMGPDFSFIGEQYLVQVGGSDYKIDLLLHHRGLNSLVAIELKTTHFKPEYLGKLQFYLEALDRDIKKPHENPSIGLLICKTKDEEVVKYAMSRNVSPALVAEYETKLIDKAILQEKMRELSEVLSDDD